MIYLHAALITLLVFVALGLIVALVALSVYYNVQIFLVIGIMVVFTYSVILLHLRND